MIRVKPLHIRSDSPRTSARLETEYESYLGLTVRRIDDITITVLPRRNHAELQRFDSPYRTLW